MGSQQIKHLWIVAAAFLIVFFAILAIRYHFTKSLFFEDRLLDSKTLSELPGKDSWMNLYLNNEKIGYSHSALIKTETGFKLNEEMFMRMNVMGSFQDLIMDTSAELNPDLSLSSFDFKLHSGLFEFAAAGRIKKANILSVETNSSGSLQKIDIPLEEPPYLTSGLLYAVCRKASLSANDQFVFQIFDPTTMSKEKVLIQVIGEDELTYIGQKKKTTKVTISYKGSTETAWVDDTGDVIREEGLLGMTLEKTTQQKAYADLPVKPQEDITKLASVPADQLIKNPGNLQVLKIRISGIDFDHLMLDGGRQKLDGDILEITRERFDPRLILKMGLLPEDAREFLKAEPFIESDHAQIRQLAGTIVSTGDRPMQKVRKIMEWISENIQQKPVLSVPDALSTLQNRVGDCNEHAVLFAALARAAGIPAKIEAGLVYLNGRFYYHAWNSVYVGKWTTADSIFKQFPADATHIRFVSGSPKVQLDLMSVIDKVKIKILAADAFDRKGLFHND